MPSTISWSTCTLVIATLVLCHTSWIVSTRTAGTRSLFTPERTIMSLQSIISIRSFSTMSIGIYFSSNVSRLSFACVIPILQSGHLHSFLVNRKKKKIYIYIHIYIKWKNKHTKWVYGFAICLTNPSLHLPHCRTKLLCIVQWYLSWVTLFKDYVRVKWERTFKFCFNFRGELQLQTSSLTFSWWSVLWCSSNSIKKLTKINKTAPKNNHFPCNLHT